MCELREIRFTTPCNSAIIAFERPYICDLINLIRNDDHDSQSDKSRRPICR